MCGVDAQLESAWYHRKESLLRFVMGWRMGGGVVSTCLCNGPTKDKGFK